ncbi:hypothetical protein C7M84_018132 [Penaeus vannamei]|uniref:Uncharacterized protein n=1 Tax=Penaeus vannamei TaxID=6689 RepID=A0A3R7LTG4_PENVA|nr:hypothetical protein C7M84_018132 [Penaeus vannamei]
MSLRSLSLSPILQGRREREGERHPPLGKRERGWHCFHDVTPGEAVGCGAAGGEAGCRAGLGARAAGAERRPWPAVWRRRRRRVSHSVRSPVPPPGLSGRAACPARPFSLEGWRGDCGPGGCGGGGASWVLGWPASHILLGWPGDGLGFSLPLRPPAPSRAEGGGPWPGLACLVFLRTGVGSGFPPSAPGALSGRGRRRGIRAWPCRTPDGASPRPDGQGRALGAVVVAEGLRRQRQGDCLGCGRRGATPASSPLLRPPSGPARPPAPAVQGPPIPGLAAWLSCPCALSGRGRRRRARAWPPRREEAPASPAPVLESGAGFGGSWLPGPSEGLPSVAPGAEPCPRSCGLRARADNYRGKPPSAAAGWRGRASSPSGPVGGLARAVRGHPAGWASPPGRAAWALLPPAPSRGRRRRRRGRGPRRREEAPASPAPVPKAGQALGGPGCRGRRRGCLPWPPGPSPARGRGGGGGRGRAPRRRDEAPASPAPVPESGAGFGGSWLPGPSEGCLPWPPGPSPARGRRGRLWGVLAAGAVGGAAFRGPRGRALPAVVGAGFGGSWLPGPSEGLPSVAPGAEPCPRSSPASPAPVPESGAGFGGSWLPGPSEGLPSVAPGAEPCPRSCGLRARADNYRGEPPSAAAGWRAGGKLAVGAGRGLARALRGHPAGSPCLSGSRPESGAGFGGPGCRGRRRGCLPWPPGRALPAVVRRRGRAPRRREKPPSPAPVPESGAGFGGSWLPGPSEGCLPWPRGRALPAVVGAGFGGSWLPGPSEGCLPWPPGRALPAEAPASPAPVPKAGQALGVLAAGAVGGAAFRGPRAEPCPRSCGLRARADNYRGNHLRRLRAGGGRASSPSGPVGGLARACGGILLPLPLRLPSRKRGRLWGVLAAGAVGGAAFRGPRGRALPAVVRLGLSCPLRPLGPPGAAGASPRAPPVSAVPAIHTGSLDVQPRGLPSLAPGAERPLPRGRVG